MKNLLRTLIIFSVILMTNMTYAQTKKFGHLDFAELYTSMPGLDSVRALYEEYALSVQDQFNAMQTELESKVLNYQSTQATMSSIIRQTKEKEIQDLQGRMEAFQVSAQQDLQNKEAELTEPIIAEAEAAVKAVAKEKGYNYIFNTAGGMVLFADPGDDILDMVKKKLGIQ